MPTPFEVLLDEPWVHVLRWEESDAKPGSMTLLGPILTAAHKEAKLIKDNVYQDCVARDAGAPYLATY
jgi:hypothetical protein